MRRWTIVVAALAPAELFATEKLKLELLRSLQTQGFGDIPALVISADVRPPDWPITSFIPKPFDLDAILRAVRRALGKATGEEQKSDSRPWLGLASWLVGPELGPA